LKRPDKISSVILWSVISAAFIGPGTVTTAVTAGSKFKLELLWSVIFAALGCIFLQEISARITIASGLTFGESLRKKFGTQKGKILQWVVGGSVVFGCAAYEAGNILGAVAGLNLITGLKENVLTIIVTVASALVLWIGGKNWISSLMTFLVLIMGVAFIALAVSQNFLVADVIKSSVVPSIPLGSELIVLGLVGTTIVPYNIFIGAAISKGQTIPLMRLGLAISVFIGGLITAAILIAGISVESFSSFSELASIMSTKVGAWGGQAVAFGLFAAGFSSAITSPYASALIASTVFGFKSEWKTKLVWGTVLLTGFAFGISGVKPIPVILAVQAINGLILPLLTLYLIVIVNDKTIVSKDYQHAQWYNLILYLILFTVTLIGMSNIDKTASTVLNLNSSGHFIFLVVFSALVVFYAVWLTQRKPEVQVK
jgi:manganese transport protein